VRGYALTGNASFLEPYKSALQRKTNDERAFRAAVVASGTLVPTATILALTNRVFTSCSHVRELAASGAPKSQLVDALNAGKSTMDGLRLQIASVEADESATELTNKAQIATLEDQVTSGEFVGLALSILGSILGAIYFSRSITRRLKYAVRNAHRLGQGEPLELERPSGDEFDEMAAAMRTAEQQLHLSAREAQASFDALTVALERSRSSEEVLRVAQGEREIAEQGRLVAEADRENVESQLHQSQRLEGLGQLAGGVAHDFNNLLAVILNFASFVSDELSASGSSNTDKQWDGAIENVHQIQVAAERASLLTHQLLSFARREVVRPRELNLNDAITQMEQILRRTIGGQIELMIELSSSDVMVIVDPGQIEQVVLNLAVNARDAMPSGGSLLIKTMMRGITNDDETSNRVPPGLYACISVSDTGSGMSAEVRDRAFEPFFSTKPKGEGSGLGLATVYGIVKQAGGNTKIYTDEGFGTTVTVLLPAIVTDAGAPALRDASTPQSLEGTETILIVDDEAALGEVARRILVASGYEVLIATCGAEAIEWASSFVGTIHLLLTDVVMPSMQGPAVAREVRKLRPDVRLLYMSGHALPVLGADQMVGAKFSIVEKPFDRKSLLKSVRQVLDHVG
jgi:hypothetical protein